MTNQNEEPDCVANEHRAPCARYVQLKVELHQLRTAYNALLAWQPIETAPKDTKVLVTRFPASGRPPINLAWFSTSELRKHCKPWKLSAFKKLRYHPTHWKPVPGPPQ